jgi:hypothetical protein
MNKAQATISATVRTRFCEDVAGSESGICPASTGIEGRGRYHAPQGLAGPERSPRFDDANVQCSIAKTGLASKLSQQFDNK